MRCGRIVSSGVPAFSLDEDSTFGSKPSVSAAISTVRSRIPVHPAEEMLKTKVANAMIILMSFLFNMFLV